MKDIGFVNIIIINYQLIISKQSFDVLKYVYFGIFYNFVVVLINKLEDEG